MCLCQSVYVCICARVCMCDIVCICVRVCVVRLGMCEWVCFDDPSDGYSGRRTPV